MEECVKDEIVERLKAIIQLVEPHVALVSKYGGLIAKCTPGEPTSQFCGIFTYKNHVSLEFTNGALLDDSKTILAGNGKYRRHIKIITLTDIVEKRCEDFLRQAHKIQRDLR